MSQFLCNHVAYTCQKYNVNSQSEQTTNSKHIPIKRVYLCCLPSESNLRKRRRRKNNNNSYNNNNNNNNNDRIYVSRKRGGRGLASIEDRDDASIQRLKDYIEKHRGLITALRNDTDNTMENRMTITRKQKWEENQLYGSFKRLINNISLDKTWTWLRKGNFKRETESLLIAAQNNAVRSNHIKGRIDKS